MERRELVQARMQKGWTQKQAAEEIGVSEMTLRRWERGECDPYPINIQQVCSVYGATAEKLGFARPLVPELQYSPIVEAVHPFTQQDLTMRLLRIIWQYPGDTAAYAGLQMQVGRELEHTMEELTRREALQRLALVPVELAGISYARFAAKATEAETLVQIAAGLAACWHLRKGQDLTFVSGVVGRYIPLLKGLLQSPHCPQTAADLLAQCHLMKGLLAWHTEGHAASIIHTQKAAAYGEAAGNVTMQIIATRTGAAAYYYAGHYARALDTGQRAKVLMETANVPIPAIARSYVYAGLATYQAHNQQRQEALRALGKAREAFFAHGSGEPVPVWIDHYTGNLVLNDGRTHFHLSMQKEALDSYAQIHHDPQGSEAIRVEAHLSEAMAEVFQAGRDMEFVLEKWTAGVTGARALQSEQRYHEAQQVYAAICAAWPAEPRVKALREHLRMA